MVITLTGTIFKDGPKPLQEISTTVYDYKDFKDIFFKVQKNIDDFQTTSGFGGAVEVSLEAPKTKKQQELLTSWRYQVADDIIKQELS